MVTPMIDCNFEINVDKEISKAQLGAAGWNMDSCLQMTPGDADIIYLVDGDTGKAHLFGVPKDVIEKLYYEPSKFTKEELVGTACSMMQMEMDVQVNSMGTLLADYVSQTECYRLWRIRSALNARMHALVMVYGGLPNSRLRPAILRSDALVMPAEEVEAASKELLQIDRQNHPEWFAA